MTIKLSDLPLSQFASNCLPFSAQAGFVNPKSAVAKVKPSDFEEAARRACKLNVKDAQAIYPDVSEENIPYLCIDLVYQYTLLVDGFGMA